MKSVVRLLALCWLAASVRGDTIFSTFDMGQSFVTAGGWPIGGSSELEFAASFVPTKDFTLDSIDFAASLFTGSDPLTVEITADDNSAPGAEIESFAVASVPASPAVLTVDSPDHPLLLGGSTYWVVLSTGPGTIIQWNWNDDGFVGVSLEASGSGSWMPLGTEVPSPAFDVMGTPTGGGATIPEPSSGWLLAAAIVGGLSLLPNTERFQSLWRRLHHQK